MPHDALERVCVRAPNWVGDVVMATPAFRAVRRHFPSAHVTLVVRRPLEPVVRGAPWFDEVMAYGPSAGADFSEFMHCAGRLRGGGFDLGLVLPQSFSAALMFRMGGVKRRVGYARDVRSFLLTDALPRPAEDGGFRPTYMVDYYLALCEALGMPCRRRDMELPIGPEDCARADDILAARGIGSNEQLFLLHPGAGFGPSKRWPTTRFSRVADMLSEEHGARVAVVAGPAERRAVDDMVRAAEAPLVDLSDCGIDLHLLKRVVARSSLLVTTDSGPRHYGVALGVPTVCIMGPTHPGYSTSDRPHDSVVRLDVDCGPCQEKECAADHRCMTDITAEMVVDACGRALTGAVEEGRPT